MNSDPTSPPKDTGEEEARAPSSPSPRKRRRRTTRHPFRSRRPCCRSPRSLLLPLPPPYLPRSILHSPQEEMKRLGLLHLFLRGKGGGGACGAPLLRAVIAVAPSVPPVPLLLPLLLPLLPLPPLRPDVCIVALPDRLIVASFVFRSSPRAPSALLPLFRCIVGRSSAGSLASSSKRLIVM